MREYVQSPCGKSSQLDRLQDLRISNSLLNHLLGPKSQDPLEMFCSMT